MSNQGAWYQTLGQWWSSIWQILQKSNHPALFHLNYSYGSPLKQLHSWGSKIGNKLSIFFFGEPPIIHQSTPPTPSSIISFLALSSSGVLHPGFSAPAGKSAPLCLVTTMVIPESTAKPKQSGVLGDYSDPFNSKTKTDARMEASTRMSYMRSYVAFQPLPGLTKHWASGQHVSPQGICSFTTSGPTNAKGECLMKQKGYKQKHNQNISYSTNKCLSNCSRNISCLSCDCVVCLFVVFDPWYTSPPSHSTPQWPAWELRPKRSGRTGRLAPSMASLLLRRKPTALYTDESAGQCGRYMVNCQGTR